jgi:hypothetical protein
MTLPKTGRALLLLSMLLPTVLGGCRYREPWGGCPHEDVVISPDFITPWGTTLEQDTAQLVGSYRGTFAWGEGENIITIPKAGEEFSADAIVEIDPTTARMRVYHSTEDTPVCESNYLWMEATVSFVRLEDEEVELRTTATIKHTTGSSVYISNREQSMPASELNAGLVPLQDFDTQGISTWMWWGWEDDFAAEYRYRGESSNSPGTGYGVSKVVAEFSMP